ncbi:MAG: tetratricopeptide repeat protein [bacterium]
MSLGISSTGPLSSLLERLNSFIQPEIPHQFDQVNQVKASGIEEAFSFDLFRKGESIPEWPINLEPSTREAIAEKANQHKLANLTNRFPELSSALENIFDQTSQVAPATLGRVMDLVGKQSEDDAPDLINNLEAMTREFIERTDESRAGRFLHSLSTISEEQIDSFLKINQAFLDNYPPSPPSAGPAPVLIEQNPENGVYNIFPTATEPSPPIDHQLTAKAVSIDFNLNLFYSLSQSISETRGQETQGAFIETTRRVSEYFEANVSLDIGFMGQYLGQTDTLNQLDPSLLDSFFESVQGLADFEDESLLGFFKATDNLFAALEEKFGSFGGVFDQAREEIKAAVGGFFGSVQDLLTAEVKGPDMVGLFNQAPLEVAGLLPESSEAALNLEGLWAKAGQTEEAKETLNKALKLDPDNIGAEELLRDLVENTIEPESKEERAETEGQESNLTEPEKELFIL